ncbi:hypothetical protein HGB13_01655 [bacterium]|nr:hypothetical protein [bacterium]
MTGLPPAHLRSWGRMWTPDMPYRPDFHCPECNWDSAPVDFATRIAFYQFIVGFSDGVPSRNSQREASVKDIGGLIFECPECFTTFWYHAFESMLDRYIENCPLWPPPVPDGVPIYKTWGVMISQETPFARDFACTGCGYNMFNSMFFRSERIGRYIVGFSTEYQESCSGMPRDGAAVFECPKCFTKFCFHLTDILLETYAEQCPLWPRE